MNVPEEIKAVYREATEFWEASDTVTDVARSTPRGSTARREIEALAARLQDDGDKLMTDVFRRLEEIGVPAEVVFDWEED